MMFSAAVVFNDKEKLSRRQDLEASANWSECTQKKICSFLSRGPLIALCCVV